MLSKVYGAGVHGTDGFLVSCEADVSSGFPQATIIGLLSSEVREALERVRTAIKNSGFELEPSKVTVNLSPAYMRKEGCGYDLPIAIALLKAYKIIKGNLSDNCLFAGELSLGGGLLPIHGTLCLVSEARAKGLKRAYLPRDNAREGSVIEGIEAIGISNLRELVDILNGKLPLPEPTHYEENIDELYDYPDYQDVSGQELIKRATILAVSGRHNILLIGPAGTGKSMIASRIPGIMPDMSTEERLNISKLYSISGLLSPDTPLLKKRPFRSPHHTISPQALSGGGTKPKPGEISLATHGVLFLDEFAEFKSDTIEVLRQPMEDKKVVISRMYGSYEFPADFILVAATNPCKCGYYPDRARCRCTPMQVKSYLSKLSKPILDRIDICVETKSINYDDLKKQKSGESSKSIRARVEEVRLIQQERFKNDGIRYNSEMNNILIENYCRLSKSDEEFLKKVYEKKGLSARALHKILKVSRTIADFEHSRDICHNHLCEAISYRALEDKYFGGNAI